MTSTIDSQTMHLLAHQGRRMNYVLHEMVPPDRKEAVRIQQRVDDLLDRRPKVRSVAGDGEIIWDDQSSWVKAQAELDAGAPLPPGATVAVNKTGRPEHVLPHGMIGSLEDPEEPDGTASGSIGLLEPPRPATKRELTIQEEQAIARFHEQLAQAPETEDR
jgi:hypothetical protein